MVQLGGEQYGVTFIHDGRMRLAAIAGFTEAKNITQVNSDVI
jgi:hypothetical protein